MHFGDQSDMMGFSSFFSHDLPRVSYIICQRTLSNDRAKLPYIIMYSISNPSRFRPASIQQRVGNWDGIIRVKLKSMLMNSCQAAIRVGPENWFRRGRETKRQTITSLSRYQIISLGTTIMKTTVTQRQQQQATMHHQRCNTKEKL